MLPRGANSIFLESSRLSEGRQLSSLIVYLPPISAANTSRVESKTGVIQMVVFPQI